MAARQYGLIERYTAAQINPIDGRGVYLSSTPPADGVALAGLHIWKANDTIAEVLAARRAAGAREHGAQLPALLAAPTPDRVPATPQWFSSMEQAKPARRCAQAIEGVHCIRPGPGAHRRHDRRASRTGPSRAAHLGRAIALFVHRETGEPHPRSTELMRQVATASKRAGWTCGTRSMPRTARRRSRRLRQDHRHTRRVVRLGVTTKTVLAERGSPSRPTCTWKARTSTAAGSSPRC
ncbi:hypothetical protein [Xanthomonas translucens]|uniref:hypothetical protein n=1 Tax=Xanthomonas campestris pv. translucens TaxID=343 RepID=UPI0021D17588|nr:hypothetical protein [Xanthomonas translucens]